MSNSDTCLFQRQKIDMTALIRPFFISPSLEAIMPCLPKMSLKATALGAALLSLTLLYEPTPVYAQFGGIAGAVMGGMGGRGYYRGGYSGRRGGRSSERSNSDDSSSSNNTPSSDTKARVYASLAAPTSAKQTAILKSIVPASALGAVGSLDDRDQVGEAKFKDAERDYTVWISDIIGKLKTEEGKQRASGEGDISEHAISQAVDDSYKRSHLDRFASFVGENWTQERLRVKILERVDSEIKSLQNGTNKGRVSMEDLRSVIDRSADIIYQRLFESSELLAANRSSTLFVQSLYQTHGDMVVGEVRESVERMLMRRAANVGGDFNSLIQRDARAYALGYRKERIVFDCLSENIVKVSSSVQGIATPAEIDKRIGDFAANECKEWLRHQFVSDDKKLPDQQPVPLRTVWTKTGPLDDPSMYSRPAGAQ
jgi:hypothetical protein